MRADQQPGQQQWQHDARAGVTLARADPCAHPSADPRARPRSGSNPPAGAHAEPSAPGRALARNLSNTSMAAPTLMQSPVPAPTPVPTAPQKVTMQAMPLRTLMSSLALLRHTMPSSCTEEGPGNTRVCYYRCRHL
jgi:hypothetical protein